MVSPATLWVGPATREAENDSDTNLTPLGAVPTLAQTPTYRATIGADDLFGAREGRGRPLLRPLALGEPLHCDELCDALGELPLLVEGVQSVPLPRPASHWAVLLARRTTSHINASKPSVTMSGS